MDATFLRREALIYRERAQRERDPVFRHQLLILAAVFDERAVAANPQACRMPLRLVHAS